MIRPSGTGWDPQCPGQRRSHGPRAGCPPLPGSAEHTLLRVVPMAHCRNGSNAGVTYSYRAPIVRAFVQLMS